MSSATWTPDALSSERRRLAGPAWRVVEAQHRISTLKLVDTLAEQAQLEEILERAEPPVPRDCQHLHYLHPPRLALDRLRARERTPEDLAADPRTARMRWRR